MAAKRYLDVRYDVTDLDDEQADQLALEAQAQAERSDGHPAVEVEIDTVEVEVEMIDDETRARLQRAIHRADVLFRSYVAADDTTRANGSDSRDDLLVAELAGALFERKPSGIVANVLVWDEASEQLVNALRDEQLARDGVGVREVPVGGQAVIWFDPYLALYDPHDPNDEPLFFMYGDAEGGTLLAPDADDVDELERRLVRFFGDSGWTIDDHGEVAL